MSFSMMQFLFWLPHCQNLTEGSVFYSYCGIFRSLENRGFYFLFCFDIGHFDNGFGSNTEISTLAKQNNICSHLAPMQHPLSGIDRKTVTIRGTKMALPQFLHGLSCDQDPRQWRSCWFFISTLLAARADTSFCRVLFFNPLPFSLPHIIQIFGL